MIDHIFASKQSRKRAFTVLAALLLSFAALFYAAKPLFILFKNHTVLEAYLLSFGPLAPLAFIGLQIIQVLIAPIPGQVTAFVSGYLFGWWKGTIYTMVGLIIGSFIAFFLARRFGRPFVEKVVDKPILEKFDYLSTRKGQFALFMLFLLPAFPDDALCFIAGLTAIPLRQLVAIAFLGRLPGMIILNLVGNGIAHDNDILAVVLFSFVLAVSVFGWYHRKSIEGYYHSNSKH